jgi:hypothetical protein
MVPTTKKVNISSMHMVTKWQLWPYKATVVMEKAHNDESSLHAT